jgi:hypothetical protein
MTIRIYSPHCGKRDAEPFSKEPTRTCLSCAGVFVNILTTAPESDKVNT